MISRVIYACNYSPPGNMMKMEGSKIVPVPAYEIDTDYKPGSSKGKAKPKYKKSKKAPKSYGKESYVRQGELRIICRVQLVRNWSWNSKCLVLCLRTNDFLCQREEPSKHFQWRRCRKARKRRQNQDRQLRTKNYQKGFHLQPLLRLLGSTQSQNRNRSPR